MNDASWALLGLAFILLAFVIGRANHSEFPRLSMERIVSAPFAFWSGLFLLSYAALAHFLAVLFRLTT